MASGFGKALYSRLLHKSIRYHFVFVTPERDALIEMGNALASGLVRSVIQEEIPICDSQKAHSMMEDGHVTGKLVLIVNQKMCEQDNDLLDKRMVDITSSAVSPASISMS